MRPQIDPHAAMTTLAETGGFHADLIELDRDAAAFRTELRKLARELEVNIRTSLIEDATIAAWIPDWDSTATDDQLAARADALRAVATSIRLPAGKKRHLRIVE